MNEWKNFDISADRGLIMEACCPTERKCKCECKLLCYTLFTHYHRYCQYIYITKQLHCNLVMNSYIGFKIYLSNYFTLLVLHKYKQGLEQHLNIPGRSTVFTWNWVNLERFWSDSGRFSILCIRSINYPYITTLKWIWIFNMDIKSKSNTKLTPRLSQTHITMERFQNPPHVLCRNKLHYSLSQLLFIYLWQYIIISNNDFVVVIVLCPWRKNYSR